MGAGPDPSLVPIFEAEVAEIVGTLQASLLRLEQGAPDGAELLADMLRLTHDVKGSARVVGYGHVAHLAHAFESRLLRWRGIEVVASSEIGLALAASDLLSQLTSGREAPELVARAEELARTLEGSWPGSAPLAAVAATTAAVATSASTERPTTATGLPTALPPAALPASRPAAARERTPAMRVVQATESLRVPRVRIDAVLDGVADALQAVLAGADQLAELQRASHELHSLRPPREGASPRERARAYGEAAAASHRVREAVRRLTDARIPLDRAMRCVDERARELCLVPFEPLATHLERVARDTAVLLGRELAFTVEGRQLHIAKELADAVKGPLTHAVRNAVDHGLESPDERERLGKPRAGALTLSLVEDDQHVRLELRDDGRGIDRQAVRARLGASAEGLDDRELLATLLRAGVSTRDTVTEISGRGVGLGSLAAVAEELRGEAMLRSEPGRGTTLELQLPQRMSLLRGLLVHAAGSRFLVPAEALVSVRTPCAAAIPLAAVLGLDDGRQASEVVMLRGRDGLAGLLVDQIDAMREVVRRPLGNHLGRAPFVQGVTVLGAGEPVLILDPREVAAACPQTAPTPEAPAQPAPERGRHVLLVDDSPTLRARLEPVLIEAGYEVSQAEDGLAALALLGRVGCDAIVSDVQMPRMDGWQLLGHCAGRVPFVLMTACPEADGPRRAQQSGACAYVAKDDALAGRVVAALHTALSQLQESLS